MHRNSRDLEPGLAVLFRNPGSIEPGSTSWCCDFGVCLLGQMQEGVGHSSCTIAALLRIASKKMPTSSIGSAKYSFMASALWI